MSNRALYVSHNPFRVERNCTKYLLQPPLRPGRPATPQADYARALGINLRRLGRLGGMARLMAMSEEARRFMVKPVVTRKKSGGEA